MMKTFNELYESLWANIHKKRQRIKKGSGERMRKKGDKGAPTAAQMKRAKGEDVDLDEKGHTEFAKTSADHKREKEQLKVKHDREKDRARERDVARKNIQTEKAPDTSDAMKRYKSGKAGFTDIAHLKAKGLIKRSDGTKKKSDKYK